MKGGVHMDKGGCGGGGDVWNRGCGGDMEGYE